MRTYEEQLSESFDQLLTQADLYFEGSGKLHSTLSDLTRRLDASGILYAVLGAVGWRATDTHA